MPACRSGPPPIPLQCAAFSPRYGPRRNPHVTRRFKAARTDRLHPPAGSTRPRRAGGGRRRHAVSAGAERLSAHRPCQEHLPELRRGPRVRRLLLSAFRRHQSVERRRRIRRFDPAGRPLARFRLGRAPDVRERLFRAAVRLRYAVDSRRQSVRRRSVGRRDPHDARHADGTRQREPAPQSPDRGERRSVHAHARRRVSRRGVCGAREDRHGLAERQHARSGALPHPARAPPAHRRQVVHLSDVRLHALHLRCARRRYALVVHARVRRPSSAVRLGARQHQRQLPSAADRVLPPRSRIHRDEQAVVARTRNRETRRRLGRSAHADDRRLAPPRRYARGDPRLLRSNRRNQAGQRDRAQPARVLHPPRSGSDRAARDGGGRPAESDDHELSERVGRSAVCDVASPTSRDGGEAAHVRPHGVHRARRFRQGAAAEIQTARGRRHGAVAQRLHHPLRRVDRRRERRRCGIALQLRTGVEKRLRYQRTQTEGRHPLGVGRFGGGRRVPFVRAPVQRPESGEARLRERAESGVADGAQRFRRAGDRRIRSAAFSVRAARLLLQRRLASGRPAGVQQDGRFARRRGQGCRRQGTGKVAAVGSQPTVEKRR